LAAQLGLPAVSVEIVAVSEELIRLTPQLAVELPRADSLPGRVQFLEELYRRRQRVPDLILEAKRCNRQPFPNWM
jgi:hypothetical protein